MRGVRRRIALRGVVGLLFCVCAVVNAHAVTPAEWDACEGSHSSIDKVAGCTKIIKNPAATTADRAKAYVKRGWAQSFDKHYDAAYADLAEAIKLDPKNAYTYDERARIMQFSGEVDRPIADYTSAIALQGTGYEYFARGELYRKKGEFDRAAADFTQAVVRFSADIAAHPESQWIYFSRSRAYRDLGDIDDAIKDHDAYLKRKKDTDEPFLAERGDLYQRKGDLVRAIADYTAVIAKTPDQVAAYEKRALAYRLKGDYKNALLDYDHLIQLTDTNPPYLVGRGLTYVGLGKPERAVVDFTKAIDVFPEAAAAFYDRAQAQREMGNLDVAIADYATAIKLDPNYAVAYNSRGRAYFAQNDPARALADYNDAIRLNPRLAAAYYNRAVLLEASGKLDEAIEDFGRAIVAESDNKDFFVARAMALYRKGSFAEAEKDCTVALRIDPVDTAAYVARAQARLKLGTADKALDDANRAVLLDGTLVPALKVRAEIHDALGQKDKALADRAAVENAQLKRDAARRVAEEARKHPRYRVTIAGPYPQAPPYLKLPFKFDNAMEVRDDEVSYYVPTLKPFKMPSGEKFEEDFAGLCNNQPTSNPGHRSVTAVFDKYLFQVEYMSHLDFTTGACRGKFIYYRENFVVDLSDGGCKFSYWMQRDELGNTNVGYRVSDQTCKVETVK